MELKNCIICYQGGYINEEWIGRKCQTVLDGENAEECMEVRRHLSVVFLLRKLLEVPQDMCVNFLESNGSPNNWIYWCDRCSIMVEKSIRVYDQLQSLEKKYKILQIGLRNAIKESEESLLASKQKCANLLYCPTDIVRSYVTKGSLNLKTEVDFEPECNLSDYGEDNLLSGINNEASRDFLDWEDECYKEDNLKEEPTNCTLEDGNDDVKPFACKLCPKMYSSRFGLKYHYGKYHPADFAIMFPRKSDYSYDEKPFVCQICPKRYNLKQALKVHCRKEHLDVLKEDFHRLFPSQKVKRVSRTRKMECKPDFQKINKLNMSGVIVKDENIEQNSQLTAKTSNASHKKKFSCDFCPKSYNLKQTLKIHCRNEHLDVLKEDFDRLFPSQKVKRRSGIRKIGNTKYKTDTQKINTWNLSSITVNEESIDQISQLATKVSGDCDQDRKFPCDFCPNSYSMKQHLKSHCIKNHLDIIKDFDRRFPPKGKGGNKTLKTKVKTKVEKTISKIDKNVKIPCEKCGKEVRVHRQKSHYRLFHAEEYKTKFSRRKEKQAKCPYCDYTCGKGYLQTHINLHLNAKPFSCDICSASFRSFAMLRIHKRGKHNKQYQCDQCGKFFATPAYLSTHRRTVHQKQFKLFCEICNQGFQNPSYLNRHMMRHRNERNELCSICGQTFIQKSRLNHHMRSKHTGERPAQCKICPKAFFSTGDLTRHIREVHRKERKDITCE